jgi:hypothetical protein
MDKDTIQQIAAQVVAQLPLGLLMIVNVVIAALVSALTALGVSYFRTRGQNLATKHDFEELQKQLKANTELVETIKSEVSQRDWAQREWTNLRRVKLEALLEKMHESEAYLDRLRSSCNRGEPLDDKRDPINELDAIGTLYFPELRNAVSDFYQRSKGIAVTALDLGQAISKAGNDLDARQSVYDTYNLRFPALYNELVYARHDLTTAARSLLERIMNVDEGAAQKSDERRSEGADG